jgi:hypothetical protein
MCVRVWMSQTTSLLTMLIIPILEASSDGEKGSDERSISTLEQLLCNLNYLDCKEAEVRMAETSASFKALCDGLGDDYDESDDSVTNA